MNSATFIEWNGVSVLRPDREEVVLDSVDWQIREGEWWVVEGGHGSGKSHLLQGLAGLIPLSGGTVTVRGELILPEAQKPTGWRKSIGLVFEGGGRLFRDMTVAENIALPLAYHQDCSLETAFDRVASLIHALDLDRLVDVPAGRIGRSWAQRVALARTLSLEPELLLVDHPVAGMDPHHLEWWRKFLAQWVAGHPDLGGIPRTLVLTTDDLQPWLAPGRLFARVYDHRFYSLGGASQVLDSKPAPASTRLT